MILRGRFSSPKPVVLPCDLKNTKDSSAWVEANRLWDVGSSAERIWNLDVIGRRFLLKFAWYCTSFIITIQPEISLILSSFVKEA